MKKFLMLLIAGCILLAVPDTAFAQKKKKDKTKKSKISVHGEKDNDGVYNQRKNSGNDGTGTAGKSKKKKGKKAKKDTGLIQSSKSNDFYVFYKRDDNSESLFA